MKKGREKKYDFSLLIENIFYSKKQAEAKTAFLHISPRSMLRFGTGNGEHVNKDWSFGIVGTIT